MKSIVDILVELLQSKYQKLGHNFSITGMEDDDGKWSVIVRDGEEELDVYIYNPKTGKWDEI